MLIDYKAINIERCELMEKLKKQGIITQVHYMPVYKHPYYENLMGKLKLTNSEYYYNHVLTLPLFPVMTGEDVEFVVSQLSHLI